MLLELMHLHISSLHQGSATHGPPERRITSDWHCLALPYLWQRTSSLPFTFCLFFTSPQPLSSSQLAGQPPLCRFSDCLACCSKRLPTPALHKGENQQCFTRSRAFFATVLEVKTSIGYSWEGFYACHSLRLLSACYTCCVLPNVVQLETYSEVANNLWNPVNGAVL